MIKLYLIGQFPLSTGCHLTIGMFFSYENESIVTSNGKSKVQNNIIMKIIHNKPICHSTSLNFNKQQTNILLPLKESVSITMYRTMDVNDSASSN